jgi:DNA integrity scanning protein DisA with diadenylate cyclase activity
LLSLGLFFIYKTLQRLGTWKILVGIFIAIGMYLAAFWAELEGIIWIYENLSQVTVIGFIVLFQPEIRKLFEVLVTSGRRRVKKPDSGLSSFIAEAVDTLARQKRGALIVLPGKESVNAYLSGGETVDAEFSNPLVLSIFDPHSPGHDGAIIIEEGKISRFGARLPISPNEKLSKIMEPVIMRLQASVK